MLIAALAWSAFPGPATGQDPLREGSLTTDPIPQAPPASYLPCGDPVRTGLCLPERIREMERVSSGQFESDNGIFCRLLYPADSQREQFICGELLVGLRPRTQWTDIRAIRQAANGEWVRISGPYGSPLEAQLVVERGTERSAFRNIMLHPMVMWVKFNHACVPPDCP